jgi:putative acetyltransferase
MRGLNIGTRLIERLVEEARNAGYRRIVLDSHMSMTKAHAIYEGAGFRRVPAPTDFPEEVKAVAIFMECDLASTRTAR